MFVIEEWLSVSHSPIHVTTNRKMHGIDCLQLSSLILGSGDVRTYYAHREQWKGNSPRDRITYAPQNLGESILEVRSCLTSIIMVHALGQKM
jgi:hypothetical protein